MSPCVSSAESENWNVFYTAAVRMGDTDEQAAFRLEVRAFLNANADLKQGDDRDWSRNGASTDPVVAEGYRRRCMAWQRLLADNGWAGITWPKEFGGRGGTSVQQMIFNQEIARYDATSGFITATLALVGSTLMAHATPEQQERHLGPLLRGEELWCQLFSEPEAGSDLSNVGCRAVRDGDEFVVNGQKVWNSEAQHAAFGILLVRTSPDLPKHDGITFLMVDMSTPGIEVRPLVQAQGVAHFNEVFFDDVRIPIANVIGDFDGGWKVTRTTLRNESSMISGAGQATTFPAVLATARRVGRTSEPVVRQELARVWSNEAVLRYLQLRTQTAVATGRRDLAIHGSLLKNAFTRTLAHRVTLALDLEGPEGMLDADAEGSGFWQYQCLNQFASRIGGGTEEIHRNNLAEQALGLPREQRTDLDVPWRDLQRRSGGT
jgi:alkylation response protein AidB-like acyl-CoA dehydrogenase